MCVFMKFNFCEICYLYVHAFFELSKFKNCVLPSFYPFLPTQKLNPNLFSQFKNCVLG